MILMDLKKNWTFINAVMRAILSYGFTNIKYQIFKITYIILMKYQQWNYHKQKKMVLVEFT